MKLTRQHMAGIAFALLLIAVVVLHLVGGDSAHDVAERLEGAMGLALTAFLGETVVRARGGVAGSLLLLVLVGAGCGGSSEQQVPDAVKRAAARCAEAFVDELGAGGEAPAIDRTYPRDEAADPGPQEDITMESTAVEGPVERMQHTARALPPRPQPSLGRVVLYALTAQDVWELRTEAREEGVHQNNYVEGEEVAADIVRVFTAGPDGPVTCVNLRLKVDGYGQRASAWKTSVREAPSDEDAGVASITPGCWRWPPRV